MSMTIPGGIKVMTKATESPEATYREIEHRRLAREAACEGIVLLENDGALPISPCPIALFGAGAAATIKGGTGSGEVNERHSVTIEQGLIEAGFTITTDRYLREYEELLRTERNKFNKAMRRRFLGGDFINIMTTQFQYPAGKLLTDGDLYESAAYACIYVIARQAGEGADRKLGKHDFDLMPTEIANLKFLSGHFKKTIVAINSGGQMDLSPLGDLGANAIVYFCQQGMEGAS